MGKVGAPYGNKNAEKWTLDMRDDLLNQILVLIRSREVQYLHEIGLFLGDKPTTMVKHVLPRFGILEQVKLEIQKHKTDRPSKYKNTNRGCRKKINKRSSIWVKTKRDEDIVFRVRTNFSALLYYHLKNKTKKTFDGVGYSVDELMAHLEGMFKNGMSWENYGSYWHIDHVIPASWFKYNSEEDYGFKQCWRLENLKPMIAKDNMSKGNRYSENPQLMTI